MIYGNLIRSQH